MTKKTEKNNKKTDDLVNQISELSVLELSKLVSALQEKLGVSAVPVATVPSTGSVPTAGGASAEASAPTNVGGGVQTVVLTETGANKIAVIKALREINRNLTLMDAKTITETVPAEVLKEAQAEDAKAAADKLKAAGATVELK